MPAEHPTPVGETRPREMEKRGHGRGVSRFDPGDAFGGGGDRLQKIAELALLRMAAGGLDQDQAGSEVGEESAELCENVLVEHGRFLSLVGSHPQTRR